MQIRNHTKNTILAETVVQAKSLTQKSIGMIAFAQPTALVLTTRFGIHTFFMKYAIDVLVLDKENLVVAIKEYMKPNRMFIWNPKYSTVLELPSGTIQKTKTKLGDKMEFSV